MKVNNAVSGAVFVIFAAALFFTTRDFPDMPGQSYGGDLFPRVIGTLMALGGFWLIYRGIRERHAGPWFEGAEWLRSPRHMANVIAVIAALVFYILLSDILGFPITAMILLTLVIRMLRGPGHLLSTLLIAALTTAVMHQFFGQFLRVPLPWGIFQNYAF